ncbi:uncharacterized protein LY79DRAFT_533061 [Colletotrichum navitas]|uniref:Uncharacterized protein n=1 Tax=Colletotrichum navitas TaxID=681940 RepID=A0AAD8QDA8_9PEZI|nr:uncharacterized protein LY79DRAFT_533061 [Colletotrichum navitas]KAK1600265.1 hypothetical protein LY79DRAFT_533061 [Colletotrichum navitas]
MDKHTLKHAGLKRLLMPTDIKTLLFWHVYMPEWTLSLMKGRASVTQDWDVTLLGRVDNTMVADPWGAIITHEPLP